MRFRNLLSSVILILSALVLISAAHAASPSAGELGGPHDEVTWSSTFYASNPAACLTSTDPACDHLTLTVSSNAVRRSTPSTSPC